MPEKQPLDVLGMVSVGCAILSAVACCIPFAAFLSMAFAPAGFAVGGIGFYQCKQKNLSPVFSIIGLVINGLMLALWAIYLLTVIGLTLLTLVGYAFLVVLMVVAG